MASIIQRHVPSAQPRPAAGAQGQSSSLASNDALALTGVVRAFGALRAVDDVSLTVAAGQKYAVLGSNGAGKTTLFNAITGDFPPTAGRIHFFGEDITELPPHERIRKGLRRTYQSSLLFRDLTVRDNLFLAVRGVSNGRYSLLRAGAGHVSRRATEELLDRSRLTHVGDELVANLAYGQQRQLEIGMALAGAPRLILFDEPAAGLSPAERRELVALLRGLRDAWMPVAVAHGQGRACYDGEPQSEQVAMGHPRRRPAPRALASHAQCAGGSLAVGRLGRVCGGWGKGCRHGRRRGAATRRRDSGWRKGWK